MMINFREAAECIRDCNLTVDEIESYLKGFMAGSIAECMPKLESLSLDNVVDQEQLIVRLVGMTKQDAIKQAGDWE
jgi:hypothetical protein